MSEIEAKIILSAISFLIGIVAWSLKGWISEKIMKRRASDRRIKAVHNNNKKDNFASRDDNNS